MTFDIATRHFDQHIIPTILAVFSEDAMAAKILTEIGIHCHGRVRPHWLDIDARRVRVRLGLIV